MTETGKLYVVGTPIGNLSDFSPRGIETLESVDYIAAEDTRVTLRLLTHFGIKKPLLSYYKPHEAEKSAKILELLHGGNSVALVSDAGMPCISDPGVYLVQRCYEQGVPVESVPCCNAAIAAVAISGIDTARFAFEGFLPVDKKERRQRAVEVLEKVGLGDQLHKRPTEMSGGQMQRVAIARALATDPEIIYFDEPTSALDPELTGEVLGVMRQLAKEGMTMLVVTHEMGFARNVSNKVVFMENGVVVEEGPSKEFFANPREERTRTFLQNIEQHYE